MTVAELIIALGDYVGECEVFWEDGSSVVDIQEPRTEGNNYTGFFVVLTSRPPKKKFILK